MITKAAKENYKSKGATTQTTEEGRAAEVGADGEL